MLKFSGNPFGRTQSSKSSLEEREDYLEFIYLMVERRDRRDAEATP